MNFYFVLNDFYCTACTPQSNLLTSGGTWCYGYGVIPSSTSKNGIPINWPPVYQAGRVAQFNWQTGLAVNTIGSLIFVADTGQNLIRQVYCSSGERALAFHQQ